MSTYIGKSKNECGEIRKIIPIYKEGKVAYMSDEPTSIRAIFKKERLIWPYVSKFAFSVSLDPDNMNPGKELYITVKAGWQKTPGANPTSEPHPITIYVKSSTRSGRNKYPYVVDCIDNWTTINNYTDTSATIMPSIEENSEKYDDKFTLYIKNNTSFSERATEIKIYQIDSVTGLPSSRSKLVTIHVVQESDTQYGNASFGTGTTATWYSDSTFNIPCSEYGSSSNGASISGGYTDVYVKVTGHTWMWSGTTNDALFGENGESLDTTSFVSSFIKSVDNLEYKGQGKWHARLYWKDNEMTEASKHVSIKDLSMSPDKINYGGAFGSVTFYLFYEGTAVPKEIPVTLQIPSSDKWEGNATLKDSVICWQQGGTATVPIIDDKAQPKVTKDISASWVTITKAPVRVSSNKYTFTFAIEATPSERKANMQDDCVWQGDKEVKYLSTSISTATLKFRIYVNDNVYEERKCTFSIAYGDALQLLTLTQEGSEIGNWYEATSSNFPKLSTDNLLVIYKENADSKIVKNIGDIQYQGSYWNAELAIENNLKTTTDPIIVLSRYPKLVSYSVHDDTTKDTLIEFTIKSGEINSEQRSETLKIVCPTINLGASTQIIQKGSIDATATIYHDNEKCVVTNTSDNKTVSLTKTTTSHTYSCYLPISENTLKETDPAYVKPLKIESYSVGAIDNDINSILYVQVKGYPAYKGKERTITFKIESAISTNTPSASIQQEAKSVMYDYDKEVDCDSLGIDDFVMSEGSEASLDTSSYPTYTSNGWYQVPLKVNKNTTPTSVQTHIQIDGKEMSSIGNEYNITEHLHDSVHPLSVWWNQTGKGVSRKASITVAGILPAIEMNWPYVPFTGTMTNKSTYNKDWKVVQNTGSDWLKISLSGDYLTASKNLSLLSNSSTLTFSFLNDYKEIVPNVNVIVTQDPLADIEEQGYVFKAANDSDIVIEESGGEFVPCAINIESHDGDWNACDLMLDIPEGLTITKKIIDGYGVRLNFVPVQHLYNSKQYNKWTLNLNQLDKDQKTSTRKTLPIDIEQAGYRLEAVIAKQGTTASIDITDNPLELQVTSMKTTSKGSEFSPFSIMQDDYTWLAIGNETSLNDVTKSYSAKAININKENHNTTTTVTVIQQSTAKKEKVSIVNKNWQASLFDETWIDLNEENEHITRTFMSDYNEIKIPLASHVKTWDNSSTPTLDPDWVTTKIIDSPVEGYDYALDVVSTGILKGSVPVTGVLKINNGVYGIGSLRITKHAYEFSATSEDATECVMYVSAIAEKLWSMYYVTSKKDGLPQDYDIYLESTAIRVSKSDNAIMLIPAANNTSNSRIQYKGRIVQKESQWTINVTIEQLTKEEEKKYDILI